MSFLTSLLQHVAQGRAGAERRSAIDAEPASQLISAFEAEAPHIRCQAVRITLDQLDRLIAIGLVDAHGAADAKAVRLQKDHDVAHRLLFLPAFPNALDAARTDAFDFLQERRAFIDDLQGTFTEDSNDPLGEVWPNALDQPRTKVFLDPLDSVGRSTA